MSIPYHITQRSQPGVAGGGKRRYYPSPVPNGVLTFDDLIKNVESMCTISGPDLTGAVYAITKVVVDNLAKGTIVRLGELGSLRCSLSVEGRDTKEEVNASCIKKAYVIYTPSARINKMLHAAKFRKV